MEGNLCFLNFTEHLGDPWGESPWDHLHGILSTHPQLGLPVEMMRKLPAHGLLSSLYKLRTGGFSQRQKRMSEKFVSSSTNDSCGSYLFPLISGLEERKLYLWKDLDQMLERISLGETVDSFFGAMGSFALSSYLHQAPIWQCLSSPFPFLRYDLRGSISWLETLR